MLRAWPSGSASHVGAAPAPQEGLGWGTAAGQGPFEDVCSWCPTAMSWFWGSFCLFDFSNLGTFQKKINISLKCDTYTEKCALGCVLGDF